MDKIIVKDINDLIINKDGCYVISEEVQSKNYEINIMDCKATIIDLSSVTNKTLKFTNSDVTVIETINDCNSKLLNMENNNSNIDYNIIDLYDNEISYSLKEITNTGKCTINIASVSYKNKKKNYVINTSNLEPNTFNEINCFGIVKDESLLNYDVSSFIKNGAKKAIVRQNSNILLFDEKSIGKNNPILIIEENDVKASHGSSIGKIDDDTMFYLCSRGLSKNEATNLICLGKMEHLINKINDESIKESLIKKFKERMG